MYQDFLEIQQQFYVFILRNYIAYSLTNWAMSNENESVKWWLSAWPSERWSWKTLTKNIYSFHRTWNERPKKWKRFIDKIIKLSFHLDSPHCNILLKLEKISFIFSVVPHHKSVVSNWEAQKSLRIDFRCNYVVCCWVWEKYFLFSKAKQRDAISSKNYFAFFMTCNSLWDLARWLRG